MSLVFKPTGILHFIIQVNFKFFNRYFDAENHSKISLVVVVVLYNGEFLVVMHLVAQTEKVTIYVRPLVKFNFFLLI